MNKNQVVKHKEIIMAARNIGLHQGGSDGGGPDDGPSQFLDKNHHGASYNYNAIQNNQREFDHGEIIELDDRDGPLDVRGEFSWTEESVGLGE